MTYSTQEIVDNGVLIERWLCDVNEENEQQSNGSQEFLYEYKGYHFTVWMNWDNKPILPNEMVEGKEKIIY
jgi:hypothetical protein